MCPVVQASNFADLDGLDWVGWDGMKVRYGEWSGGAFRGHVIVIEAIHTIFGYSKVRRVVKTVVQSTARCTGGEAPGAAPELFPVGLAR